MEPDTGPPGRTLTVVPATGKASEDKIRSGARKTKQDAKNGCVQRHRWSRERAARVAWIVKGPQFR